MTLDPLLALGALDGRYRSKVVPLAAAMSEFGLLHARVEVGCRGQGLEPAALHLDPRVQQPELGEDRAQGGNFSAVAPVEGADGREAG